MGVSKVQEFTAEYKKIKNALDKCWNEMSVKKDEKNRLQEARKKVFADIYLGKVSSSKKEIFNKKIRQLEEDISSADIAIEELKLKQTLLKRSGSHIQEVEESKNV